MKREYIAMTPQAYARTIAESKPYETLPPRGLRMPNAALAPLEALTAPARKELRSILKECNKGSSTQIELLCERIHHKEVRDVVLCALCEREYLLWKPAQRGRLLKALIPYAEEPLVLAYAMAGLREPGYKRSYAVCAPAAAILGKATSSRPDSITDELIDLAKRYGTARGDPAARIAFFLLRDATLTTRLESTASYQARVWYAEHRGRENPWLDLLAHHRSREGLSLLKTILTGNVNNPHDHTVLFGLATLPFLPHEIAFVASIIGILGREACKLLGQNNRIANSTAIGLAVTVIIGGRFLWHAAKFDAFNNNRSRERVQALSLLATLLQSQPEEPSRNEKAFFKEAHRLLNDAASGFAQSPPIRVAAKAALDGTTELKALWALAKSSLDNSTNDYQAADPYGHS